MLALKEKFAASRDQGEVPKVVPVPSSLVGCRCRAKNIFQRRRQAKRREWSATTGAAQSISSQLSGAPRLDASSER